MPDIGIVLSGGFAKCAYQVGVLRALHEFIGNATHQSHRLYISASSMGAFNACAYVKGRMKQAEKAWYNFNVASARPLLRSIGRPNYIPDLVDAFVGEGELDIKTNLYVTCFNTTKVSLDYVNLKKVEPRKTKKYLRAGIAVPIFARTVEIAGNKYCDGATVDNIPIKPLMKHHLDYIIVVHFDSDAYSFENEYFDNKLIKINFMDDKVIKNSFAFDRGSISYMFKTGYEHAKSIFEVIFENGTDDLAYIYRQIAMFNSCQSEKQLRITGDVVVNNINKILKKII
ncbi:MAG: patatin-like phospholipase family protein [Oscillospiraceae bacterium]|nr:patatin-like phospholipase family protein [Oscillospiraceae bacterium]